MTYIIGLTGGIGSGKTVASDHFEMLGVPIIDTDVIARTIVEPGQSTLLQLVAVFGGEILEKDGTLDRHALRKIAFDSTENKARLDRITHPAIRRETIRLLDEISQPYCIVVIPLLTVDSPFSKFLDRILVVTADRQTKIERVKKRSDLTSEEVEKIMQTQLSDEQRLSFADDVIANDGSIEDAQEEVEKLHLRYLDFGLNHSR